MLLDLTLHSSPFVRPACTPCDHTFCETCIRQSLVRSSTCPVCRVALAGPSSLSSAPRIIHQLVDDLEVACSHSSLGCTFTGPRSTLRSHLVHDCAYAEAPCPCSRRCSTILRKRDLPAHLEACPFGLVPCPMSCGAHVRRAELDSHLEGECPRKLVDCPHCAAQGLTRETLEAHIAADCLEAPVACPHARFGCKWQGVRRLLLDEHIDPDVNACPYEAIKGFLQACDARMSAAEDENAALRRRIIDLEHRQTATALESLACRNSLGPFALPVTRLPPEVDESAAPSPQQTRGSMPSPERTFATTPATEMPQPQHWPQPSPHRLDDPWSGVAYGRVDPLVVRDPSPRPFESLPSTITRLNASLHTLEGSIERLEVRHEVGVLDETVRLQEEVQSLRAAVHGLRLQGAL